ncbi:TGF-beta-activated kinase 1 and MAP3K7-binding protein 2 isoform X1 [Nematostella vectensis]|uniref:TGF-beta-activated kinase 1 and MAP3K7-binding protein 2 isoform X1 n=1 Tax=Nematostella vectensis TaxID=45351 RepID=UPI0020775E01|nr:TGF-beta-activated kinase 1 and MAP3K7-binding protein 2 isoform X1 [Nematostella vectensis]
MSKVCTAKGEDSEKHDSVKALQSRFPELPLDVIAKFLSQHAGNLEKCIVILSQESDKYLYGEDVVADSPTPVPVQPSTSSAASRPNLSASSAPLEPLSITIPPSNITERAPGYGPLSVMPVTRPLTIAIPSSSCLSTVSEAEAANTRHQSIDAYSQKLIQHQQQRLERIKKELEHERENLFKLQVAVREKEEELFHKKYKVADNPTESNIAHLQEETEVLRSEVDQMASQIDKLNHGASPPLGIINPQQDVYQFPTPLPQSNHYHQGGPHQMRKSLSFPRDPGVLHYGPPHRQHPPYPVQQPPYPVNGMPGAMPMPPWIPPYNAHHGEEGVNPNQSPTRDPSLERQGWILIPPSDLPRSPSVSSVTSCPEPIQEEKPWQCKHCTLENHGALNVCEACDMPRD